MDKNFIYLKLNKNNNFLFNKKKLSRRDRRRIRLSPGIINKTSFKSSRAMISTFRKRGKLSLSHKDEGCLIGFTKKGKIGVDLEVLKNRNFDSVIDFCFNEDEKEIYKNSKNQDKKIIFYMFYTAKEALIKANNLSFCHLNKIGFNKNKKAFLNHKKEIFQMNFVLINNYFIFSVCSNFKKDIILSS